VYEWSQRYEEVLLPVVDEFDYPEELAECLLYIVYMYMYMYMYMWYIYNIVYNIVYIYMWYIV
jgi:hypothetical protein